MWPGGTSKECPVADTALLRELFPEAPILGGRGKHFVANQTIPVQTAGQSPTGATCGALKKLSIPTVVTVLVFWILIDPDWLNDIIIQLMLKFGAVE